MPAGDIGRVNLRTLRTTDHVHLESPHVDPIIKVLIRLRLAAPMSCEMLARKSKRKTFPGIPISSTVIRKWERGASSPSLVYLRRWCELLGKNLEQIVEMMGQS